MFLHIVYLRMQLRTTLQIVKKDVEKIIQEWKAKEGIRLYTPYKYFKGLDTKTLVLRKLQEMQRWKNENDTTKIKFKTDKLSFYRLQNQSSKF